MKNIEAFYPLSPMQAGMLFHSLYSVEPGVYIGQLSCAVQGRVDIDAFERAWQKLIDRHSILRTAFAWENLDQPLQVVGKRVKVPFSYIDWRELSAAEQEQQLRAYIENDRQRGFKLSRSPLMRFALIALGEDNYKFIWTNHHLLLDGWSRALLLKEVFQYYEAYGRGEELELAAPRPYSEYIAWLQRQDQAKAETYWRKALSGMREPTWLGIERSREAGAGEQARYSEKYVRLSEETSERLRKEARKHQVTLNTVVQGAWAIEMSRYSGSEEVVYGAVVSGRGGEVEGIEEMVGMMINTLPVRVKVREEEEVWKWMKEQQEEMVEMRQYEYSGLVEVGKWSEMEAGVSLFNSIFVFENARPEAALGKGSSKFQINDVQTLGQTNYPLTLLVSPGKQLALTMNYDERVYEERAVEGMLEHLARLLEEMSRKEEVRLYELEMMSEEERRRVVEEWNEEVCEYEEEGSLAELIERQAEERGEEKAVVYEEEEISYRELNRRANQLAHYLIKLGVKPETRIGLYVERSLESIIGLLGILKAGGAYVPLDPSSPKDRLELILNDAGISILLTKEHLLEGLPADLSCAICLDRDWAIISSECEEKVLSRVAGNNAAYVLYTSGTTGKPKGVVVEHRQVINYSTGFHKRLKFAPGGNFAMVQTLAVDSVVGVIFPTLLTGACLHVISEQRIADAESLRDYFQSHRIDYLKLAPSHLAALQVALEHPEQIMPRARLIIGGEASSWEWMQQLKSMAPDCTVINHYGPTETTVGVLTFQIERGQNNHYPANTPLGRPLPNAQIYILDNLLRPVAPGVAGELHIGGDGVARGYLGRSELTAEKFIPDPFSTQPGARLYKSGDLARHLPDGNVEFLGRIDNQVKVRGYRIELEEIEAVLRHHPSVHNAIVITTEGKAGDKLLAAYVVIEQDSGATIADLRDYAKQKLPDYMVPSFIVVLDEMPRTPHGKVDRKALPAPVMSRSDLETSYGEAGDLVEEMLMQIFAQVLKLDRVGRQDSFFNLGGHSLLATQLISRVRSALQVEIPLRSLFEEPTVKGLAAVVREAMRAGRGISAPPFVKIPRDDRMPLSFAQQRLWFLEQLEPGNPFYNISTALRLSGLLNIEALNRTLNEIVRRHEVLRTSFPTVEGKPAQVISEHCKVAIPEIDVSQLAAEQSWNEAIRMVKQEAEEPFDLTTGPLLRVRLVRLGEQDHMAVITMHHIISDGWSTGVLVREVSALYEAYSQGEESPLEEMGLQYADYAAWQRQWLSGAALEQQLQYWRDQLAGAPAVLELPTDHVRPAFQTFRGDIVPFTLPVEVSQRLRQLSRSENATMFMIVLAAFDLLLSRYTRQNDIVIGTPIAGRNHSEIEGLIGFFVNTMVLRVDLSSNPGFKELLRQVKEVTLEAYAHQELPFEKLVEEIEPERSLSYSPVFQVMMVMQNNPESALSLKGLKVEGVNMESQAAKFDLMLTVTEGATRLSGSLEYASDLFERETVERLGRHLVKVLEEVSRDAEQKVSEIKMLNAGEQKQLLEEWNETEREYEREASLAEMFEQQVKKGPERVAVKSGEEEVSYGELNRRANRLGNYLRKQGVGAETRVGLMVERSIEMVVGLLGIVKAGGAYVPLDVNYPEERVRYMLKDAGVEAVVTQESLRGRLPEEAGKVISLDGQREEIEGCSGDDPALNHSDANLAYIIYTSGSTGMPKGVAITHRSGVTFIHWAVEVFEESELKAVLASTSICFDLSVFEIFVPLSVGGKVVVVENALALMEKEEEVTLINTVPSAMWELVRAGAVPESVKVVNLAGEALKKALVEGVYEKESVKKVNNLYGPSEDTTYSTHAEIKRGDEREPSIGRAVANTKAYVLDEWQGLVGIGVTGELYIGGEGLARGYHNRAEQTAEKFVPDPFSRSGGERMYRTGDLARWRADGNIEFLGRVDHQVKVRGYRIELGEIESVLSRYAGVKEAVVVVRQEENENKRIVAYVVGEAGEKLGVEELRSYVKQKLPAYMVPSAIVNLEEMPLTPNGKLDRKALPPPDAPTLRPDSFIAPRNQAERTLAAIWQQLLGLTQISINDNFFELGGDSILSIQIVARANAAGLKLTPRQMFQHQTIAELAEVAGKGATAEARGQQGAVTGEVELTPIQARFFERGLKNVNHYNQSVMLEVVGEWNEGALRAAVEQLMEQHDALRMRFEEDEDGWRQYNEAAVESVPVIKIDLSEAGEQEQRKEMEKAASEVQKSLDIRAGKMMRVAVYELGRGGKRVQIVVHHLVVDGVSWRILLEDLQNWYEQADRGERLEKREKTSAYKEWAAGLKEYANSEKVKEERKYWEEEGKKEVKRLEVEKEGGNEARNARSVMVRMEAEETKELLQEVVKVYGAKIDEVLIGGAVKAIGEWMGGERVRIEVEGHGREEVVEGVDVTRTVGWFTSIYPVVIEVKEGEEEQVGEVKRQMRRVPEKGIGYGVLNYEKGGVEEREKAEVIYNYLGQFDRVLKEGGRLRGAKEYGGATHGGEERREHLLEISCRIVDGRLEATWRYSEGLHRRETIEKLAGRFEEVVKGIIRKSRTGTVKSFIPSDFPLAGFNQQQLDKVLSKLTKAK